MAKKKFSISHSLATGIKNTVDTASENRGQLQYELMNIDVIELDPDNPRKLSVNKSDILSKASITEGDKVREIESLTSLSESIKRVGVRNAIEVYKNGAKYRLISGERRLLASILAGKKNIPARINNKPDEFKLRYLQWIENINREDLSLWEKYLNLKQIADSHHNQTQEKLDGKKLAEILGISTTQAYRYYCLIKAESDILTLVKDGKLNNLKILDAITHTKDKELRNHALDSLKNDVPIHLVQQQLDNPTRINNKIPKLKSDHRGRRAQVINFGTTGNILAAKRLCQALHTHEFFKEAKHVFNEVDWSSPKSITEAFKEFLNIAERIT